MEEAKVISPDDLTQYHAAADIANRVILRLVNECVVGRKVVDLCANGDKLVAEEVCGGANFQWISAELKKDGDYKGGVLQRLALEIIMLVALLQLAQVFKTGVEKGIAFPTCVSINNCIGNYSPLSDDALVLSAGDVVNMYAFDSSRLLMD